MMQEDVVTSMDMMAWAGHAGVVLLVDVYEMASGVPYLSPMLHKIRATNSQWHEMNDTRSAREPDFPFHF